MFFGKTLTQKHRNSNKSQKGRSEELSSLIPQISLHKIFSVTLKVFNM